ncbi:MAG: hypothetical protein MUC97_07760, partial [Bernardetiaceae bacterium]|nr:hypothetical protein [Bernardetiaceae bacterium]
RAEKMAELEAGLAEKEAELHQRLFELQDRQGQMHSKRTEELHQIAQQNMAWLEQNNRELYDRVRQHQIQQEAEDALDPEATPANKRALAEKIQQRMGKVDNEVVRKKLRKLGMLAADEELNSMVHISHPGEIRINWYSPLSYRELKIMLKVMEESAN